MYTVTHTPWIRPRTPTVCDALYAVGTTVEVPIMCMQTHITLKGLLRHLLQEHHWSTWSAERVKQDDMKVDAKSDE